MNVLEIIKKYYDLGFLVWPVRKQTKLTAYTDFKDYKETFHPSWETVEGWFTGKEHGVSLVMGDLSKNVVALDFDDPRAYDEWAAKYPAIVAQTAVASTPNGYHVLLRCKEIPWNGKAVNNQAIDVISQGWYIVVWPSIHPSGEMYQWITPPWDGIAEINKLEDVGIETYQPAADYGEDEWWCDECNRPEDECVCDHYRVV